jgi:hypothetical protein
MGNFVQIFLGTAIMTLKFKVVLLALLLTVGVASCDNGEHQGAANKAPAKEAAPTPPPATPPPITPPKEGAKEGAKEAAPATPPVGAPK